LSVNVLSCFERHSGTIRWSFQWQCMSQTLFRHKDSYVQNAILFWSKLKKIRGRVCFEIEDEQKKTYIVNGKILKLGITVEQLREPVPHDIAEHELKGKVHVG